MHACGGEKVKLLPGLGLNACFCSSQAVVVLLTYQVNQARLLAMGGKGMKEIDPHGMKYGRISEEDLFEAVRLHPKYQITWNGAESLFKQIKKRPWPSFEEADRTSIYPQLLELLDKAKKKARDKISFYSKWVQDRKALGLQPSNDKEKRHNLLVNNQPQLSIV